MRATHGYVERRVALYGHVCHRKGLEDMDCDCKRADLVHHAGATHSIADTSTKCAYICGIDPEEQCEEQDSLVALTRQLKHHWSRHVEESR